ncbi:MAG: helix-turn-helix domain-containing protein [Waterburya sp.]
MKRLYSDRIHKRLDPHQSDNEFKKLRKNARLSQEELAGKIGVAVSTIRRWEHGQAEPTMTREQMEKFCAAVKQPFIKLPKKLAN